jgi:hypothetical protein
MENPGDMDTPISEYELQNDRFNINIRENIEIAIANIDTPHKLSKEELAYALNECVKGILNGQFDKPEFDTSMDWIALKNPDADLFMTHIKLLTEGYNWLMPIYNSPMVPMGDIVLTRKSLAEEAGILGTLAPEYDIKESGE